MALVLEILLGAMILASFFVAYMSAKTWRIDQVVLLVFVFLAAVAFFYLGARTLATHRGWGQVIAQKQSELDALENQAKQLDEGGGQDASGKPLKGIRVLRQDLEKMAVERGGVLYDVEVTGVKEGVVQLTFKTNDHGLVPNTVLFVFDQTPVAEGGRYRGEFKVVALVPDSPTVQVAPNLPLTPAEMQQLAGVKGPWTLYATMPIDDPATFASLDDQARAALLPKSSVAEFAKADRELRDYEGFFHESYVQRTLLADIIDKTTANIKRTEDDTKLANDEIAFRQGEKTDLQSDLSRFQGELKTIAGYQGTLGKVYQEVRESLKATFLAAKQRATELTVLQGKAAEEINQRTAAAQAASAPPLRAGQAP